MAGVGHYVPERVMTNADFEKILDTTDEWIVSRTGMHERHIARDDETTSDMGLAAAKMANESPNQTLQPTALVHEAWLRLTGNENVKWDGRAHFFGAAADRLFAQANLLHRLFIGEYPDALGQQVIAREPWLYFLDFARCGDAGHFFDKQNFHESLFSR